MWYSRVVASLSAIPDFINHYENELADAKKDCRISGIVEKNITALPGITEHRFNQLQKVDLKAIQSEPYLDRLNCELREDLKCICQNQEINLYASYRSNSEEWILRMVQAGIGVALMPVYTLPKDATDISFRYLVDPEISRQIYAIYTHQTSVKPKLQALIANLSRA